jgi:hypothetical protein
MSKLEKSLGGVGILMVFAVLFLLIIVSQKAGVSEASVTQSSEYIATTTGSGGGFTGGVARIGFDAGDLNAPISGSIGSIYFALPTTGQVDIYDATTTDITKRTGAIASTTLLMASFPAGTGTSTVSIDSRYRYGLIVVFKGSVSSTTVTYR